MAESEIVGLLLFKSRQNKLSSVKIQINEMLRCCSDIFLSRSVLWSFGFWFSIESYVRLRSWFRRRGRYLKSADTLSRDSTNQTQAVTLQQHLQTLIERRNSISIKTIQKRRLYSKETRTDQFRNNLRVSSQLICAVVYNDDISSVFFWKWCNNHNSS